MAWTPPGAGQLRDRIAIERRSATRNDAGSIVDGWTPLLDAIPAKIVATRGGEAVQAMRLAGTSPFDVTIRLTPDTAGITSGDRLRNTRTGATMNIRWVGSLEDGRASWLSLSCVAGEVSDG
jgi:head-tail adaptor